MTESHKIQVGPGSEVAIRFCLSLEDGTVVDETEGDEPHRFIIGDGSMIEGLEECLYDMPLNEEQTFLISPDEAFGYPDTDNIHEIARSEFPEDMELAEGVVVNFSTPAGDDVPGMIIGLLDDKVQVDFNHPLAGRNLAFRVELIEVVNHDEDTAG